MWAVLWAGTRQDAKPGSLGERRCLLSVPRVAHLPGTRATLYLRPSSQRGEAGEEAGIQIV